MAMQAEIKAGKLIIIMDLNERGEPSRTGRTSVHASTHGNVVTPVLVNGKPLVVGVNAYTK